ASGETDEAIAAYEEGLRRWPRHLPFLVGHGSALKAAGRTQEAIAAYRRAIAIDAGDANAWWGLANLKTAYFDAADIAAMTAALERPEGDAQTRALLGFSLGKALEDAGEHEASFARYAAANALRRRLQPHDAAAVRAEAQATIRLQDRAF